LAPPLADRNPMVCAAHRTQGTCGLDCRDVASRWWSSVLCWGRAGEFITEQGRRR